MKPNEYALIVAEAFLGVYSLLPWAEPSARNLALGGLLGLVAGHVNGRLSKA